jgi:preprotein translocase subunit SecE
VAEEEVGKGNFIQRGVGFVKEVKAEFAKVNWPSREELFGSTSVVIVLSILVAFFIGAVDLILSNLLTLLLR